MAFSATSKRPWKINVIASTDAELSLPDVLPDRLAHSAHIQFNFEFPPGSDIISVTMIPTGFYSYHLVQSRRKFAKVFQAVHQVGCGMDEICRRLAEVPVKRDIEICLSDLGETTDWETKKTVVQPFSRLRDICSFRLGMVSGWPDDSRQELARYLEVVTGRISQSRTSE